MDSYALISCFGYNLNAVYTVVQTVLALAPDWCVCVCVHTCWGTSVFNLEVIKD